jgi:hypothetical protein
VFQGAPPHPLILLCAAALCLGIVLMLRRLVPGKQGLAMFLAIAFGPAGHLYLRGAARYVLLMYAAWIGLLVATPLPPIVSAFLLTVLSALLMNARMHAKPEKAPDAPHS